MKVKEVHFNQPIFFRTVSKNHRCFPQFLIKVSSVPQDQNYSMRSPLELAKKFSLQKTSKNQKWCGKTSRTFKISIQFKYKYHPTYIPSTAKDFFNVVIIFKISSTTKGRTRRERLKSALYLRLKKRKTFFFGKKLEIFEKKISSGKCRTVPKNVKEGTLFDL